MTLALLHHRRLLQRRKNPKNTKRKIRNIIRKRKRRRKQRKRYLKNRNYIFVSFSFHHFISCKLLLFLLCYYLSIVITFISLRNISYFLHYILLFKKKDTWITIVQALIHLQRSSNR